jgi:hypothetical protein
MRVADFTDEEWPEGYGAPPPGPKQDNDLDPPAWIREVPPHGEPIQQPAPIVATPFTWRAEAEIPPRKWLYGRHLLRRFVSVDVAAGGTGKSSVKIGEALAMASGRDLYGVPIHDGPHNVWLYNLEDPSEETERRIHATAKWFHISPRRRRPALRRFRPRPALRHRHRDRIWRPHRPAGLRADQEAAASSARSTS